MRQFAEQEIILPSGPYEARRFNCDRQPFARLWFDAIDSRKWARFVATGPSQSGKTLACFVIPALYHLFEVQETTIIGLPDLDMATDKWTMDFLPVIERSRYRDLLPLRGAGSKGGKFSAIQFRNGRVLKFMSGGGGDKSRAGFTAAALCITETDGLDESAGGSREADKISQLEARTRAYIATGRKRVYMECTVSIPTGRTWREYQAGTASKIILPCPHCSKWVSPEREHFTGWQGADSQPAARATGTFCCPECGTSWTDGQRAESNRKCRLLHRGQAVDGAGQITGPLPPTDTLGFRWSAVNNLLVDTADLAADEWTSSREVDEENAEKRQRQFVWAIPYSPPRVDLSQLDWMLIAKRMSDDPRGFVPGDARRITIAIDLGKYLCHWLALAWRPHASPHIVDYGRLEVATAELGEERALLACLRDFRDSICLSGFHSAGGQCKPSLVIVDSGWHPEIVDAFCIESGQGFMPAKGIGHDQPKEKFNVPGRQVILVGDHYSVVRISTMRSSLVEFGTDHWKAWAQARMGTPIGQPGAMTLYRAAENHHLAFAKHATAERRTEEFVAGKGLVTKFEQVHRNNHWLDAFVMASVAGHGIGERLMGQEEKPVAKPEPNPDMKPVDIVNSYKGKW